MPTSVSPEFLALQQALAGRYSIERELGRGGMGIVLLARDVALDRLVAIKLLPPHLAADPEYRARFLQEARTAAGLSHPNIVPIHLVEEHGELVFFVMSYVEGETLRERVERAGALTPRFAMKLMQEVAWGLAYAHQRGVIHRDIKPDNIMIEQGTDRALLTDFGIAVRGRGASGAGGEVIGTARYMSPEQALGETVDGRSDLYSLGATFFYALTGRAPFTGSNLPAVLAQQVSQPAPAIEAVRPQLPAKLAAMIDGCLQKAPDARPQTGDEVARILGEVRGRDFRAPPLVRSFVRNAQVTTMVFLAVAFAGQVSVGGGPGNFTVGGFGPGLIGTILIIQLVRVARRLLREGYTFDDIRTALLAEAQIQDEESQVIRQRRWVRRLDTLWHKLWAGKFGRWFFRVAGAGLKPPERRALPSHDATELVLADSARAAYEALPPSARREARDVPDVVEALESRAETLRARGETGERLTETVAALENLRLALLKLGRGMGSMEDLTVHLQRARDIGERVDRQLAAQQEVADVLGRGSRRTA
jgi:hypothetical protein